MGVVVVADVSASDAVDVLTAAGITVVAADDRTAELDLRPGRVRSEFRPRRTAPTPLDMARDVGAVSPDVFAETVRQWTRLHAAIAAPTLHADMIHVTSEALRVTLPAEAWQSVQRLASEAARISVPTETLRALDEQAQQSVAAFLRTLPTARTPITYVVEQANEAVRQAAKLIPKLSVVSVRDRRAVVDGREFEAADATPTNDQRPRKRGRVPWGRYALMRALARTPEPRTQAELADECDLSQAAVSQHLDVLGGQVTRARQRIAAADANEWWDRFLADYPGPCGIRTGWYGLDPIMAQAETVLVEAPDEFGAIVSGDAAADRLAPWRVPARAVVYSRSGLDLSGAGFAPAVADEATLDLVVPSDTTVWASASAWRASDAEQCADPLVAAWEVQRTGGPDAAEAIAKLRERAQEAWR